jgi:hypothetical protein
MDLNMNRSHLAFTDVLLALLAAVQVADAQTLKGAGDETATLARLVREQRHVTIPGGLTVTISDGVAVPPDTTIDGPGTIHLASRAAGLSLGERCLVRDVRFTCGERFAHGSVIRAVTTQPGVVRRMDCRIVGCTFEKMRGQALFADEVSHVSFESNLHIQACSGRMTR